MRNFEERKAEVFRRSAQRIKARKTVVKTAVTCSLMLCLFAGSLGVFSLITPIHNEVSSDGVAPERVDGVTSKGVAPERVDGVTSKGVASGKSNPRAYIEIRAEGETAARLNDPQTVSRAQELLDEIMTPNNRDDAVDAAVGDDTYILTLVDSTGETREFTLWRSTLTDQNSGEIYQLSPEQLTELKRILQLD